jgi:hypothetical protein
MALAISLFSRPELADLLHWFYNGTLSISGVQE